MATELPEEPKSRKEQYLADIAGQDVELPAEPKSREEQYLAYIAENGGGGGGGGTSNFNQLSNRPKYNGTTMTGDTNIPEVKTYTAGSNITISGNEISATDTKYTAGTNVSISDQNVISATDTTYSAFTGTDGTAAGSAGLVPAPATTDAGKYLKADGTWDTAGGGGGLSMTELTSADYDYPTSGTADGVAVWTLTPGFYYTKGTAKIYVTNSISFTDNITLFVGESDGSSYVPIIVYMAGADLANTIGILYSVNKTNGARVAIKQMLAISQDTGTSTSQVMSQKATTDTISASVSAIVISGAGAPTTSTTGTVGRLYEDTTNGKLYICTDTTGGTYTWAEVGASGGGPTVVQTTGTSTTDVMSQDAVTKMVWTNSSAKNSIRIGNSNGGGYCSVIITPDGSFVNSNVENSIAIGPQVIVQSGVENGIAIGNASQVSGFGGIAIGAGAEAILPQSVALGRKAKATVKGQFDISTRATTNTDGYNNSQYRLLTGLYDPQSAHDAATKGYVDPTTDSSAPTTATVGRLGQIQIDTTNADAYMCVAVDDVTPSYTWKKINV